MDDNSRNEQTNNRQKNKLSNEDRTRIVQYHLEGIKTQAISELVCFPRATISAVITTYKQSGRINILSRGCDKRTLVSEEQKIAVKTWVDENLTSTLKNLVQKFNSIYNMVVDDNTIDRCSKNFHYSLKQITLVPERRNCERTINLRAEYGNVFFVNFFSFEEYELIFVDEVGFSVSSRTKFGRSRVGSSVYVPTATIKSKNISVIAAMTKHGMFDNVVNVNPVSGLDFKEYLLVLNRKISIFGGKKVIVVMDNARIHHSNILSKIVSCLNL
jgi:transposase